ncbi:hypothetical protein K435DRAFT_974008 [Dendrothele bispora CBS 962.96]|uniref:DUF6699 domain-containing protein n=1 Tax=Dendrothele bispora (strain CBS 962.96) TaxID=1314807 RepID=A0A4S8KNZ9_DENBC|nr:hypothetical protein K435DRAFT_974008 [Dendrothele bispora CBS 962.96]
MNNFFERASRLKVRNLTINNYSDCTSETPNSQSNWEEGSSPRRSHRSSRSASASPHRNSRSTSPYHNCGFPSPSYYPTNFDEPLRGRQLGLSESPDFSTHFSFEPSLPPVVSPEQSQTPPRLLSTPPYASKDEPFSSHGRPSFGPSAAPRNPHLFMERSNGCCCRSRSHSACRESQWLGKPYQDSYFSETSATPDRRRSSCSPHNRHKSNCYPQSVDESSHIPHHGSPPPTSAYCSVPGPSSHHSDNIHVHDPSCTEFKPARYTLMPCVLRATRPYSYWVPVTGSFFSSSFPDISNVTENFSHSLGFDLHPWIDAQVQMGNLLFDFSKEELNPLRLISSAQAIEVPLEDLRIPATRPPVNRLRVVCTDIPQWPIDIQSCSSIPFSFPGRATYVWEPPVITLLDVIQSVHLSLRKSIDSGYWQGLSSRKRRAVCKPYWNRCWKNGEVPGSQVLTDVLRTVDFLSGKVWFRGLTVDDGNLKLVLS